MSSWTFETYEKGNTFAEYRWNKGNTYQTFVGYNHNGIVTTIFNQTYGNKESARRAFKHQVKKIERGDYQ